MAQIYVRSEANGEEINRDEEVIDEQFTYDNMAAEFPTEKDIEKAPDESKPDIDCEKEFTYKSMCHYYRKQIAADITSFSKAPSVLIEIIASIFNIANLVLAFHAFHQISYRTTGILYTEYYGDDGAQYHNEVVRNYGDKSGVNHATIHIYNEPVYINWRNFAYLGLCLIVVEFLAPIFRILVVTNRAPRKEMSVQSLIQLSVLISLALEDGAVSLCKNMLFAEECGIREAMMSSTSQISASMTFVNAIFRMVVFVWRSNFRNQRAVRDEMEAYTEILILEEYQWYHCIIPILSHVTVIGLTIWSLVDATNADLICLVRS